jgi:hypothetical protein
MRASLAMNELAMNLTSERVDDGYLKVFVVAQAIVAEMLSNLLAVLNGLQVAFQVDPDPVSHRDTIFHIEKELLHAVPLIVSKIENLRRDHRQGRAEIPWPEWQWWSVSVKRMLAAEAPHQQGRQMGGLGSCSLSAVHAHHVVQSGGLGFVPIETTRRQQRAFAGVCPQPFPAFDKSCDARTHALRSRNGDDDAFGRGTHGTSEGAQVKAGLILLEKRKDHRSVAVRAERALVGSFAVEKRGNWTTEHRRIP